MKLSVVISAYNEEKKIEECLKSVSFADEIIFIDNSSVDRTKFIASKYTDKIFVRENNLMLNVNKNFGISKATSDWILILDADERVTAELSKEILSAVGHLKDKKINGFWIPRQNIAFGKWIKHAGWYPDYQLRLIRKGFGKFPEKHVHEMINIEGRTEKLKNDLVHHNYENIAQFLNKMTKIYTPNEAENLYQKGVRVKSSDAINYPLKEFLSRFFSLEGYKDGLHGLVLCLFMAFYHFIVFTLLWEKQGFKKEDLNFGETQKEFNSAGKQIEFWIKNENIKSTRNPLKKAWLKLK